MKEITVVSLEAVYIYTHTLTLTFNPKKKRGVRV